MQGQVERSDLQKKLGRYLYCLRQNILPYQRRTRDAHTFGVYGC
jgi:hypothetical protein